MLIPLRDVAVLVTLALLSSACAFTDIPLNMPTRALQSPVGGGRARQVVVIVPFADARGMVRCGMQKNGYNMDTADAVCQSDPGVWLAQLLASELRNAGFTVLTADAEHRASAVRIEGTIDKLFVEPVLGVFTVSLEADLFVRLRVKSDTGLAAVRSFRVKGWKGGQVVSTGSPFNEALDRATQQTLHEMVLAVLEVMNQYPQLGEQVTVTPDVAWLEGDVR